MTRSSVILTLFMLSGCTSTSEFYSPEVTRAEKVSVGVCGYRSAHFRREVATGIVVEASPYFTIFRIEDDNSFQLIGQRIKIKDSNQKVIRDIPIISISTGKFGMPQESETYGITENHFPAQARIRGTGRYETIEMGSGEWSRWKGKADVFTLEYDPMPMLEESTIFLELPDFFANKTRVSVEPIKFVWTSATGLMCAQ